MSETIPTKAAISAAKKLLRRMRLYVCIGIPLIFVLGTAGICAVFQDDFSGGLDPRYWTVTMTTPGMYSVDATGGDVKLAKIAPTPGGYRDVEINLNIGALTSAGAIAGDFDIQVDFRNAIITGGGLNQVELHTGYKNGAIFYDVRNYGDVHVWTGSSQGGISTIATAGRFRISRVGSTVTGYFNGQEISSSNLSSELIWVAFSLQNNAWSNDTISVTYDNFYISAHDIVSDLRVYGISNRAAQSAIISNLPAQFSFKVWGKVTLLGGDYFSVDDGSAKPVKVFAPGFSGIANGDYATANGKFSGDGSARILSAQASSVKKLK